MTSMKQFEGIHRVLLGGLLSILGVLTITAFFVAAVWTGNVRLLAGVGAGVMALLVGLTLMNS